MTIRLTLVLLTLLAAPAVAQDDGGGGIEAIRTFDFDAGQAVMFTMDGLDPRGRAETTTAFYVRRAGRDSLDWVPVVRYPTRVLDVATLGGIGGGGNSFAVLLAPPTPAEADEAGADEGGAGEGDGEENDEEAAAPKPQMPSLRFVRYSGVRFDRGSDLFVAVPQTNGGPVRLVSIAPDAAGRRLLAVDDTANLWALPGGKATGWEDLGPLDVDPAAELDLAAAGRGVALLAGDRLQLLHNAGPETVPTAKSPAGGTLLDSPTGPTVLLAGPDRLLTRDAVVPLELNGGDEAGIRGGGFALGALRVLTTPADGSRAFVQASLHPVTLRPVAPPATLSLPGGPTDIPGGTLLQAIILGIMLFGLLGLVRQNPPTPEQVGALRARLAPRGRRLAAGLIDALPLIVAYGAMGVVADRGPAVLTIVFVAGYLVYVGLLLTSELTTRRSIGKILLGLAVADVEGNPPAGKAIFQRNLLRVLDGPCLVLIFLTPLRQRLGDIVAATTVVLADEAAEAEEVEEPA